MKIQAAVARMARAPLSIETVDLEVPRQGEVLVRMVGAGICHTDTVVRDQLLPTPLPVVLGNHQGLGNRLIQGLPVVQHVQPRSCLSR